MPTAITIKPTAAIKIRSRRRRRAGRRVSDELVARIVILLWLGIRDSPGPGG